MENQNIENQDSLGQTQPQVNPAAGQQVTPQPAQPTSNVVQDTTLPVDSPDKSNVPFKKLLLYYLIGLFTHIIGLIFAGLWIALKVKENKKPRLISLLGGIGTALAIGIIFSVFVSPMLQTALVNKFPEMGYIPIELGKEYPDAQFGINITQTKSYSAGEGEVSTSILTVSAISDQDFGVAGRREIGIKVCSLLERHGDYYDEVEINQVKIKKYLIFSFDTSITEGKTCQEWGGNLPAESPSILR